MTFYTGAPVSQTFMQRWRSARHIGAARPWVRVQVRRGRLERSWHHNWPNPQFGQVFGRSIRHQWYPDWTPIDDWVSFDAVGHVDLDQSFDRNGIAVATIDLDNEQWADTVGAGGTYHVRERGYLWPWRGYVPKDRPGSGVAKNEWFNRLPNLQIQVLQGYGADTAVKTFTGLIDSLALRVRPDRVTLTARDFGGVLTDSDMFGWNKDKNVPDPVTFIPHDHQYLKLAKGDGKIHRWIVIKDAVDIVKCCLRWAGFKEWEIEDSGVKLSTPYTVDKGKTLMDVINDVKTQLGYVFFISEPTQNNDLSIGVPIFRRASVVVPQRSKPIVVRDQDLLTDIEPQHDNKDDRYIIRVRGVVNQKIGRTLAGDTTKRVTFTYWPPWIDTMSGVIKQLTYYNIGDASSVGFKTVQQCAVACVLIAMQIGLARDTAQIQTPGQPAFGLDSFAFLSDAGTGVTSRLYVTNRKSTMVLGGDGTSQQKGASQGELIWGTELGGSLCDNPEMDHIANDFERAISGQKVLSWGTVGFD